MVPDLTAKGFTEVAIEISAEITAEVIAEITAEVNTEVAIEITIEILVVRLDRGVRNLVYYYVVVWTGSEFNIDAALYSTVTGR